MKDLPMSKSLLALAISAASVQDGEVVLTITPEDKGFKKAEEAYVKATEFRSNLVGEITKGVATEAKVQFEDDAVEVVTGSMDFGPTTLSATVFRNFKVKGDEGDDSIANHVVVSSVDDFTQVVTDSLVGIFDDVEADTEEK